MHLFQGPRPFKASPGNRIGAIKGNTFANLLLVEAATIHDGMVSGITGEHRLEHGGRGIGKRRDKALWVRGPRCPCYFARSRLHYWLSAEDLLGL